jgi:hypothetical protein
MRIPLLSELRGILTQTSAARLASSAWFRGGSPPQQRAAVASTGLLRFAALTRNWEIVASLGFAPTPFPLDILPLFVITWILIGLAYAMMLKRRAPARFEQLGTMMGEHT